MQRVAERRPMRPLSCRAGLGGRPGSVKHAVRAGQLPRRWMRRGRARRCSQVRPLWAQGLRWARRSMAVSAPRGASVALVSARTSAAPLSRPAADRPRHSRLPRSILPPAASPGEALIRAPAAWPPRPAAQKFPRPRERRSARPRGPWARMALALSAGDSVPGAWAATARAQPFSPESWVSQRAEVPPALGVAAALRQPRDSPVRQPLCQRRAAE